MSSQYLPKTMAEWMRWMEKRVNLLERRRQGALSGGELPSDSTLLTINNAAFTVYDTGTDPTISRIGNVVEMTGALRVVTAGVLDGSTINNVMNVPAGYRPREAYARVFVAQASSVNRVTWTIGNSGGGSPGRVDIGRHGPAASSPGNTWLPMAFMWLTNDPWPA